MNQPPPLQAIITDRKSMIATPNKTRAAFRSEAAWLLRNCRAPRLRSMSQFAEAELVIPEGQFVGERFRLSTQPFMGLFLAELATGRWKFVAVTGCVQAGKSLLALVLPILFYLFEIRETVILGAPTIDVARDKWKKEIYPALIKTRYRRYLPTSGPGSRGGNPESIEFTNGVSLKFMSAGGGDEKRSSYTARVICMTEVDKMDTAGETSREADPVRQMMARAKSVDLDQRIVWKECTTSVESGRIWQDFTAGTASRIVCRCPHCRGWVTPEREHFRGHEQAENQLQAERLGRFHCPDCGDPLTADQRVAMNHAGRLLHRGQEIDSEGAVLGPLPETRTFGFRWNAFNNLFWSPAAIAADEYAAAHADDEEEAEKEALQFNWVRPYQPPQWDSTPLEIETLIRRQAPLRKGFVPVDAEYMTVGLDPGKRVGWWIVIAWLPDGSGHVVDYGTIEIPSDSLGVERAIAAALRDFRDDLVMQGWAQPDGQTRLPDQVWIDASYMGEVVYGFCREAGPRFRPALGLGTGQHYQRRYSAPKTTGSIVKFLGEGFHIIYVKKARTFAIEVDADHWKSRLHERLAQPADQAGGIRFFFSTDRNEHRSLAKHFTAERQVEEFIPGRGTVTRWVRESRKNHWFDAGYNACAAAHLVGVRVVKTDRPTAAARQTSTATKPRPRRGLTTPDGRPFLVTERDQ